MHESRRIFLVCLLTFWGKCSVSEVKCINHIQRKTVKVMAAGFTQNEGSSMKKRVYYVSPSSGFSKREKTFTFKNRNSPQLISSVHLKVKDSDQQITVKTGDDVTLQCLDHRGRDIELLEWSKPDWKSEDYVYYFRDERSYENYQHPLFSGRVELRDPQMKDGDVSVILKNINIKDTGTYECYVGYGGRSDLISTITLTVTDSGGGAGDTKNGGDNGEHVGLIVGLSVAGVFVVIAVTVGLVIFRKC